MKNYKILVVEDEVKIASMIKRVIEMDESLGVSSVDLAIDGKEGLLTAEKKDYDLIIMDIMLPKLNGLEVCRELRYKEIMTPIIMLTARDTIEDRIAAMDAGSNDYLSKPFSFEDLINSIKTLLKIKQESDLLDNKLFKTKVITNSSLKNSELNKRILDSVPISIITIDKEGNMNWANRYYFNFSRTQEFRQHNIFESKFFIRENLISDYKKLLEDGTIVKKDYCFERTYEGEDKYLKIIAVPLIDKEGNIEGALSMAMDNTESVLFKKKLQLLNEELEQKVNQRTLQLNKANEELAKVLELKSIFVGDVSHEMRTSLSIIQGNIELMSRGLIDKSDNLETYGQVFDEISRMSGMLSDMTLLSEAETSRQKCDLTKIDINKIIADVCKSLKVAASKKGIAISHKKSKSVVELIADSSQMEKLIINLVNNAIRYNKEGGSINIWVKADADKIIMNVEDTGIGIANEYLENIFERFYRVDKARSRNAGGSGLGLAICKWIAEVHGGKISVQSILGEGSIFSVQLPRKSEPLEAFDIAIDNIIK